MEQPSDRPLIRFEALVLAPKGSHDPRVLADLDLDWLPSGPGELRALVTAEQAAEALGRGLQLLLRSAYPVGPLDPALVMTDEQAQRWLEEATRGIPRGERA